MTESKMIEYAERIKNAPTIIEADGKYITQSAGDEIRQKNYDLIQRQAVIKAVDAHTNEDGTLNDDISVILEDIPSVNMQE